MAHSVLSRCARLNIALVPINLYRETDIAGPTSLDAVDFITLGAPKPSVEGDVSVEAFTLLDGWLYEQSGLSVFFSKFEDFDNYEALETRVLRAEEGGSEAGGVCMDPGVFSFGFVPLGFPS